MDAKRFVERFFYYSLNTLEKLFFPPAKQLFAGWWIDFLVHLTVIVIDPLDLRNTVVSPFASITFS